MYIHKGSEESPVLFLLPDFPEKGLPKKEEPDEPSPEDFEELMPIFVFTA